MLYYDCYCNIDKLFYNGENKNIKDTISHFGIEIIEVNNYLDTIKELTKDENGKYRFLNSSIFEIFMKLWKNGEAPSLLSDNIPFIEETNLFLSKINANFYFRRLEKKIFMDMIQVF